MVYAYIYSYIILSESLKVIPLTCNPTSKRETWLLYTCNSFYIKKFIYTIYVMVAHDFNLYFSDN